MEYDKVLVIDNGLIIESGVPKELAKDITSSFHALMKNQ
jgi:ABC-type multidrug transport system fused ATPase/permease subunit